MSSVLIVVADVCYRSPIRRALAGIGCSVQAAAGGNEGLRLYRKTRFDVVIMDLYMPDKDGSETLRDLRDYDAGAKVVVLADGIDAQTETMARVARALGARRILFKPCGEDEIVAVVRDLLSMP